MACATHFIVVAPALLFNIVVHLFLLRFVIAFRYFQQHTVVELLLLEKGIDYMPNDELVNVSTNYVYL